MRFVSSCNGVGGTCIEDHTSQPILLWHTVNRPHTSCLHLSSIELLDEAAALIEFPKNFRRDYSSCGLGAGHVCWIRVLPSSASNIGVAQSVEHAPRH